MRINRTRIQYVLKYYKEPLLKKMFLKDNNIRSKCSDYRYKEAIKD